MAVWYDPHPAVNAATGDFDDSLPGQGVTVVLKGTSTPALISEDEAGTLVITGSILIVTPKNTVRGFWAQEDFTKLDALAADGVTRVSLSSLTGVENRVEQILTEAQALAEDVAEALALIQSSPAILPPGGVPNVDFLALGDDGAVWAPPPTSVGGTGIIGAPASWPLAFPPEEHPTEVETLRDGGSTLPLIIQQLLRRTTASQLRQLLEAVTASEVPTLGTQAGQAMPGTKIFKADEITLKSPISGIAGGNTQLALEELAARGTGGGGGTSSVLTWRYTSGAWPALPVTKPAGVTLVIGLGPTQPASPPSWLGDGPTQVPFLFMAPAAA